MISPNVEARGTPSTDAAVLAGGSDSAAGARGDLHLFGCGGEASRDARPETVGNKGANLIRMAEAGLPVPPGFVLPTDLCRAYLRSGSGLSDEIRGRIARGIREMERTTGLGFGGNRRPLMVSVRSGAPMSMPGMLDTILNVGLGDRTLPALIRMTGNPRHAWDSYRRLIEAYAETARGLPTGPLDQLVEAKLRQEGVPAVAELDVAALKALVRELLDHYAAAAGEPFPQDPLAQLSGAVEAVFRSWRSPKAEQYRRLHGLNDEVGTAVTVQAMVFGNMGGTSGSGVGFTRNPSTGENELYLDFLPDAQGEDVVSGRTAARSIVDLRGHSPELHRQLRQIKDRLELLFHDAQDFEFTVQEGRLYLLQTRNAKRTDWAALRIACELVAEGLIDEATALDRLACYDLDSIRRVRLHPTEGSAAIGAGIAASPGVAVGQAVFTPEQAVKLAAEGGTPILIRHDVATEDVAGLVAAAGLLTARGARTAHAAVVARQLNKVCIVGCRELAVDDDRRCRLGDRTIRQGDAVSLDGNAGRVYAGRVDMLTEAPTQYLAEIRRWRECLHQSAVVPNS